MVHKDHREYELAIANYTQAIAFNPEDAHAYYNRGWAYANQGDYERAIIDYTQAIELEHDPLSWP